MNCINGHSVLDSMKFCSVCGVALAQQNEPTEQQVQPTEQPEQSSFGYVYTPPELPKLNKKNANKLLIAVIAFVAIVAVLSNGEGDAEATMQEKYLAEIKTYDRYAFVSNDAALLYLKNYCQAKETVRMVASDPIDAIVISYCDTQLATDLGVTQAPTPAPDASESITQETTPNELFTEKYFPISTKLEAKLSELADYALAGDLSSTVQSCYDLKDLSERGLLLPPTGNLDFDQAWRNAMDSGVNGSNACINQDFDSASVYISEMSGYIVSATNAID